MSIMRMRLKLRGIYICNEVNVDGGQLTFNRPIFTFAEADYYKILFDAGFSLDATHTTDQTENWVGGEFEEITESLITTERFIYPLVIKPIAVIDGTVKGSTKIGLKSFGAACEAWLTKMIVSLIKIDSDANETVLGTVTQDFKPGFGDWPSKIGNETVTIIWVAFPYFFDVRNKKIDYDDRLVLEIKPYGIITNLGADHGRYYFDAAVDEDNQYIDIPIV